MYLLSIASCLQAGSLPGTRGRLPNPVGVKSNIVQRLLQVVDGNGGEFSLDAVGLLGLLALRFGCEQGSFELLSLLMQLFGTDFDKFFEVFGASLDSAYPCIGPDEANHNQTQ